MTKVPLRHVKGQLSSRKQDREGQRQKFCQYRNPIIFFLYIYFGKKSNENETKAAAAAASALLLLLLLHSVDPSFSLTHTSG